ncbi:Aflatoxin B1 aldehyde member 3 [Cyphellophora attinorum]|uniref:Aflatoxin B1 aldehyde member 3 n=1 Tax=Cyphellophora attinorum TaxID=1664694 RepID=A0A0N1NX34_9EURO|nr:Aflatoxin B1 aldehyde member 3 [Phialophora attinorum]KPI37854.1 Aflatoxin B1 aldehyde member 3 [Phialophora attinorum]
MPSTTIPQNAPAILLGGGRFGYKETSAVTNITEVSQLQPLVDVLHAHGHTTIDTSRLYPAFGTHGGSETLIGLTTHTQFGGLVDTKVLSNPGDHSPEKLRASIHGSLKSLGVGKINTIYLHYPDRTTPLTVSVPVIAGFVVEGLASRWGLSNYSLSEVKEIISICTTQNLPLPAVYQGHYNALVRSAEAELFPLLRKHGISFIAWSPSASGAFDASSSLLTQEGAVGDLQRRFYGFPQARAAIKHVQDLGTKYGISGHEVALRWVRYHSALDDSKGDGMIVAARNEARLEETLTGLERGPLPEEIADAVSGVWEQVKEGVPGDWDWIGDWAPEERSEVKNMEGEGVVGKGETTAAQVEVREVK